MSAIDKKGQQKYQTTALHQPQTQQRMLTPEQNTIKNVEAKVTIPQEVNTMQVNTSDRRVTDKRKI